MYIRIEYNVQKSWIRNLYTPSGIQFMSPLNTNNLCEIKLLIFYCKLTK